MFPIKAMRIIQALGEQRIMSFLLYIALSVPLTLLLDGFQAEKLNRLNHLPLSDPVSFF